MASVIYTASQRQHPGYRQQAKVKQVAESRQAAVTFVPALVDLQTPVRNVMSILQWRRQLVGFLGGFVSGAVSLR